MKSSPLLRFLLPFLMCATLLTAGPVRLTREGGRDFLHFERLHDATSYVVAECAVKASDKKSPTDGPALEMRVAVDHHGGEEKYPIGWPRIVTTLQREESDWSGWEYFEVSVWCKMLKGTLPERQPFAITFHKRPNTYQPAFPLTEQEKWVTLRIPLKDLKEKNVPLEAMASLTFFVSEQNYKDKDDVVFHIGSIRLSRPAGKEPLPAAAKSTPPAPAAAPAPASPRDPSWKELPFIEEAPEPKPDNAEAARGFMLFTREPSEPIYPQTRPLPYERLTSLSCFATPGEFEPVLIGLHPLRDLKAVKVEVGALVGPGGALPASALDLRHGRYVDMRYPMYTTKGSYRRVAELLEKNTALPIPAKETHQWWLTVRPPEDAKPGLYRGQVTVHAEGAAPVSLPLTLRVLGFRLKKDPTRSYTAYHYDLLLRHRNTLSSLDPSLTNEEALLRLSAKEYRAMRDFGFDTPPTGYLGYDAKSNRLYFRTPQIMPLMKEAGLFEKPTWLLVMSLGELFKKHTGTHIPPHAAVTNEAPQAFYDELTELTARFDAERKANGWPEPYYNPLDEVDASAWDFGSKVHRAVKKAGVRVYTTKDPKGFDAPKYAGCIDMWCSQPFSVPYEQVAKDPAVRYWSYPNHNTGEIKSREVMLKGGRMTYGYGFWRSGYEGLVPWMWRWDVGNPHDYLNERRAGTGMKFERDGELLAATYWCLFREGVDDLRYVYTLQQALVEREQAPDPACRALVDQGKAWLQRLWDSIEVQEKYLAGGMWPSEDFTARRWQAARLIQSLLKFPGRASVTAPSVLVARTTPATKGDKGPSAIEQALKDGKLERLEVGSEDFSAWRNITTEGSGSANATGRGGSQAYLWSVRMDHHTDGEAGSSGSGKYTKGWPRVLVQLPQPIDLTGFDYVSLWVKIDSDRDEVADDSSPLNLDLLTGAGKFQRRLVSEWEQRQWMHLLVPVTELVGLAGGANNLKELRGFQLWIPEGNYPHGCTVKYLFDDFELLRFKEPVLERIEAPSALLLPQAWFPVSVSVLGEGAVSPGQYRLRTSLLDAQGKAVATQEQDLKGYRRFALETSKLAQPGVTRLTAELVRGGQVLSTAQTPVELVRGPLLEPE